MNAKHEARPGAPIGQTKLLLFVRTMLGSHAGRPDDDHPLPPGPWDPVVRAALEKMFAHSHRPTSAAAHLGPHPEPWHAHPAASLHLHPQALTAVGAGRSWTEEIALNPQPLPPRYAFLCTLAGVLVSRAELLQELSESLPRQGEAQGIVSGYIKRFSDDFCGTDWHFHWPFPGPRPPWFAERLDGIDLMVLATQFEDAARRSFGTELRQDLGSAGSQFAETGLGRLQ